MLEHEFLFGDKLTKIIETIETEAIKKGTKQAFHDADQQIWGIEAFCIFLDLSADTILRFGASRHRMQQMEYDDELREAILAEMTVSRRPRSHNGIDNHAQRET